MNNKPILIAIVLSTAIASAGFVDCHAPSEGDVYFFMPNTQTYIYGSAHSVKDEINRLNGLTDGHTYGIGAELAEEGFVYSHLLDDGIPKNPTFGHVSVNYDYPIYRNKMFVCWSLDNIQHQK